MVVGIGIVFLALGLLFIIISFFANIPESNRGPLRGWAALLIIWSVVGLTAHGIYINNKPCYIKVLYDDSVDVMYSCKPVPFDKNDKCVPIKERVKVKREIVENPGWEPISKR